jgi:osmotically-inducible protein OsmY
MLSDENIKQNVERELAWDAGVTATAIGVSVREKIVTLTGFVRRYDQKIHAECAAQRVTGVVGVANEIEVRLSSSERLDADIAHDAVSSLELQLPHSVGTIKVVVDQGMLKLEGYVERNYQRELAVKAVRHIRGVRVLANHLLLRPEATPKDVQRQIVAAFHRHASIDAARLQVEAANGTVTLDGSVHSLVEREPAERAAWLAPGVTHVNNRITVEASATP